MATKTAKTTTKKKTASKPKQSSGAAMAEARRIATEQVDWFCDFDPYGFMDQTETGESIPQARARMISETARDLMSGRQMIHIYALSEFDQGESGREMTRLRRIIAQMRQFDAKIKKK